MKGLMEEGRQEGMGNVNFVLLLISEHTSGTDGHNLGLRAQMQQCSGALLAHGYRHDNISQPSYSSRVNFQEASRIR